MNVNINYKNNQFNIDISPDSPLSYIYKLVEKLFNIKSENFLLVFGKQIIPNNIVASSEFFNKLKSITIKVIEKINNHFNLSYSKSRNKNNKNNSLSNLNNYFLSYNNNSQRPSKNNIDNNNFATISNNNDLYIQSSNNYNNNTSLPKIQLKKAKKKNYIKCQFCLRKNSIFYCRNCNIFLCFECNIRFPEHSDHNIINLENGDIPLSIEIYRKQIIDLLNTVETSYNITTKYLVNNDERVELLQNVINLVKELDNNSKTLLDLKTEYIVDNEMLNKVRKEIMEIEPPRFKDESVSVFGEINEKEIEINNYTNFVNLACIKSKFCKKLKEIFEVIYQLFDNVIKESNNCLNEAHFSENYGIKELEKFNEWINNVENNNDINNNKNIQWNSNFGINENNDDISTNSSNNNNVNFINGKNNLIPNIYNYNHHKSNSNNNFLINLIENENNNIRKKKHRRIYLNSDLSNDILIKNNNTFNNFNNNISNVNQNNFNLNSSSRSVNTFNNTNNNINYNILNKTISQFNDGNNVLKEHKSNKTENNINKSNTNLTVSNMNNNRKNVRFSYSPTKIKRNSVDYNLTGNKSVFSRARRSELIDTSILNQMLEIPVKKKKKK